MDAFTPKSHAETVLGLAPGLYPFESRFVMLDGARIHYVDEGTGPALVMLHGNPTWSFLYRHLILSLRERCRCIAIDLPGFGLSEAPAGFGYEPEEHAGIVARILAALDLRSATLIAHDWGGPIGLAAGFAEPGRLTRFVLGNTWAWPVNGIWHFEWFSRLIGGPIGRFGARRFNLFVNGVLPNSMRRGRLPAEVMQAYRALLAPLERRTGTHVFAHAILAGRSFLAEVAGRLPELDDKPVLILWPDGDIAMREVELDRWRAILPNAQVKPIKRCGHFLWEEAAEECTDAIAVWLESQQAPARAREALEAG